MCRLILLLYVNLVAMLIYTHTFIHICTHTYIHTGMNLVGEPPSLLHLFCFDSLLTVRSENELKYSHPIGNGRQGYEVD